MPTPFPHSRPPCLALAALTVLALGVPGAGEAQRSGAGVVPPSYRLDQWTTSEGLPGNFIDDLARSPGRYLWILASGVPTRFDGERFVPLRVRPGGEGPGGRFRALAAGRADTIWSVTDLGEVVALADGDAHVEARLETELWEVAADSTGEVVVGTADGLVFARSRAWTPTEVPVTYRGTRSDTRLFPQILPARGGGLWLNGVDAGIVRTRGDTLVPVAPGLRRALAADLVTGEVLLPREGDGVRHLATPGGDTLLSLPVEPAREPRLRDLEGRIWTERSGLLEVFEPGRVDPVATVALPERTDPGRWIGDAEGNIWIGTGAGGILRIQEAPFYTVGPSRGLPELASEVDVGPTGGTWVLNSAKSVFTIHDGRAERAFARVSPHGPRALSVGPDGTVWVGGNFADPALPPANSVKGLRGYRPDGDTLFVETGVDISEVLVDGLDPRLVWIAGPILFRVEVERSGRIRIDTLHAPASERHLRLRPRTGGGVWVSDGAAVHEVTPDTVRRVAIPPQALPAPVRAVFDDPAGGLWLGTYGGGLVHWDGARATVIGTGQVLGEEIVSSIVQGVDGRLWMGGNRSVHAVSLAELREYVAGDRDRVGGISFAQRDGLVDPEGSGDRAVAAPDGRLWFPTFGGAATVHPAALGGRRSTPPRVRVESVVVDGGAIATDGGRVRLEPGVRDFDVRFTSTTLRDGERLVFEYRLVGIDAAWRRAGSGRWARYSSVRGGTHRFEVRARDPLGNWSAEPASVDVVVPRTFTETPAFPASVALLVVLGSGLVVRRRTRVSQERAQRLESMVEERTRELSSATSELEDALSVVTRQRAELEALDEAKDRFFANVTHELRTPLTLLLGPVRDLRHERLGPLPEPARQELERVEANGERIAELVDQLLDVARLEVGRLPLRPERGDLRDFLSRIGTRYAPRADTLGLAWSMEVDDVTDEAVFDADLLEKIVANLVTNAFKYTPSGGEVSVAAHTEPTATGLRLQIEVADTGRGIPADEIPLVFERFRRVDERQGTRTPGSGVGLSLVRELTQLMGGEVGVSSVEGEGSVFTVTLPLEAVSGAPAATEEPSLRDPEAEPLVLVVEDHPELRSYLRRHLETEYRVLEAEDGARGLALAR